MPRSGRVGVAAALLTLLALLGPGAALAQGVEVSGTLSSTSRRTMGTTVFLVPASGVRTEEPGPEVTIDQVHLRFVPGAVAVMPGTPVRFLNSDPLLHNIFSPGPEPFDLGTRPQDEAATHQFVLEGVHVVLCNIHPEMVAYIMVVPSPFKAVVASDGRFLLPDVPPGRYDLHVWSARRNRRFSIPLEVGRDGVRDLELIVSDRGVTRR